MTDHSEMRRIAQMGVPTFGYGEQHAAAPLTDREAERIAELAAANDDAAKALVRSAVDCIKGLPGWAFDQHLCGYLLAVLSQRIGDSEWSHLEAAGIAQDALDTTSDYLIYGPKA